MNRIVEINGKRIDLELGVAYRLEIEGTDLHIDCCLKTKDRLYQDPHWLKEHYIDKK